MSRRLIIIILVVLIVGVLGGTGVLLLQRFGGGTVTEQPATDTPALTAADEGAAQIADPDGDPDGDGLPNAEEIVWGTDPDVADTDNDGFNDGDEVKNNHNPTVAGPNDELPQGFQPRVNISTQGDQPVAVEQLFASRVELFPHNGRNLTEEFNAKFPENERTQETTLQFAQEQGIVTALPDVRTDQIVFTQSTSPLTVGHYMDTASSYHQLMDSTTVGVIMKDIFENGDISSAYGQAAFVADYQQRLRTTPVPPEAANLHRLLLGFSEVLNATYTQMTAYNEDPVKAINALYQLEILDQQYYPLIDAEAKRIAIEFG